MKARVFNGIIALIQMRTKVTKVYKRKSCDEEDWNEEK